MGGHSSSDAQPAYQVTITINVAGSEEGDCRVLSIQDGDSALHLRVPRESAITKDALEAFLRESGVGDRVSGLLGQCQPLPCYSVDEEGLAHSISRPALPGHPWELTTNR